MDRGGATTAHITATLLADCASGTMGVLDDGSDAGLEDGILSDRG